MIYSAKNVLPSCVVLDASTGLPIKDVAWIDTAERTYYQITRPYGSAQGKIVHSNQ